MLFRSFVQTTFVKRLDVRHVFAFTLGGDFRHRTCIAFVNGSTPALALHAAFVLTPLLLLLILLLVGSGLVDVRHVLYPFLA